MTQDDLRDLVMQALVAIAPEIEPSEIETDVELRDQVEVDSMDLLNFVIARPSWSKPR